MKLLMNYFIYTIFRERIDSTVYAFSATAFTRLKKLKISLKPFLKVAPSCSLAGCFWQSGQGRLFQASLTMPDVVCSIKLERK